MWAEALMLFIHRMQKYQSTFSQISAWHFRTLLGGYNGFNTETSDEKRKKVRLCQVIWVLTRYDIHSTQGEKELSWRTLSVFSSSVYRKKPRKWFCGKRECFAAGLIIYFFLVNGGAVHIEPPLHHSLNCGQRSMDHILGTFKHANAVPG